MITKDFQKWHIQKDNIHGFKVRPFFHEREIWSCSVGVNIGFESDGKGEKFLRPVLVVKKFNNESLWGVSLSKTQNNGKYYYPFVFVEGLTSEANLSQLRLIDSKRLNYKLGTMDERLFQELKEKLRQLLV